MLQHAHTDPHCHQLFCSHGATSTRSSPTFGRHKPTEHWRSLQKPGFPDRKQISAQGFKHGDDAPVLARRHQAEAEPQLPHDRAFQQNHILSCDACARPDLALLARGCTSASKMPNTLWKWLRLRQISWATLDSKASMKLIGDSFHMLVVPLMRETCTRSWNLFSIRGRCMVM